jgi:hypothetical protein
MTDTVRIGFGGSAEYSPDAGFIALGDDGGAAEPAARHRWFRSHVDGIDVGLDLFPFEPEPDAEQAAAEPEPRRPGRTGHHGPRRFRLALAGITSLAVLSLGASLHDPAEATRRPPAPAGGVLPRVAADRPGARTGPAGGRWGMSTRIHHPAYGRAVVFTRR